MKKRLFVLLMGLMVWVSSMLADVTFRVNVPEETKQCYVVGDLPELSSWAAGSAVPMSKVEGPQTIISVESLVKGVYVLQVGERVEKFVKE